MARDSNYYSQMYNDIMGARAKQENKTFVPVNNWLETSRANPNLPDAYKPNVSGLNNITQMKTADQYKEMAKNQFDPVFNEQRQAYLNALASQRQALETNKTGINFKYQDAAKSQNLANQRAKNNISNTALGRGLSRGTIVTSNLAEADQINNRQLGELDTRKMAELGDVDSRIAMLEENTANDIRRLDADRGMKLAELARQLEDRDYDRNYKDRGLALDIEKMLADQNFRDTQWRTDIAERDRQFGFDREKFDKQAAMEQAKFDYQKAQDEINNTFRKDSFEWQKAMEGAKFEFQKSQTAIDNAFREKSFSADQSYRNASLAEQRAARTAAQAEKQAKENELSNWEAQQMVGMSDFMNNVWNNSDGSYLSPNDKAKYFEDVAKNYGKVDRKDYQRLSQVAQQYANEIRNSRMGLQP